VEKSLSEQDPAIRNALRVMYTTRGLTSHPVAAHERVRADDREKVRHALMAMDATPEGRALLAKVPVKQLVPVSHADYEKMRSWGLDSYWVELWKEEQK
jgi:phosphonate transport system substrate-binding protein